MFPQVICDFDGGFNLGLLYLSLDNWHLVYNFSIYLWKKLLIWNFDLISINIWLWGYRRRASAHVTNNIEAIWALEREFVFIIVMLVEILKHYQFLGPFLLLYMPDLHLSILLKVVGTFFLINVFNIVLRNLRGILKGCVNVSIWIFNWVNAQPSLFWMSHHLLFLLLLVKRPVNRNTWFRNTRFLSRDKYTLLIFWNVLALAIIVRYDFPHLSRVCYFSSPWISDTQGRDLN